MDVSTGGKQAQHARTCIGLGWSGSFKACTATGSAFAEPFIYGASNLMVILVTDLKKTNDIGILYLAYAGFLDHII